MSKVRLNKDGTPDKRYGKKKAVAPQPVAVVPEQVPESVPQTAGNMSYIQEIIDSRQAPGVVIPEQHRADFKGKPVDMEKYKRDTGGKDPNEPMSHDNRTQTGGHL